MSDVHHVMKAVVEELGVDAPVAPRPTLVNATFVELAVFIAELVRDRVPKACALESSGRAGSADSRGRAVHEGAAE